MHADVCRSIAVGVALSLLSACGGAAREIPQAGPTTSSVAEGAPAPAPRSPAPAVVFPSEPIEPVAAPFPVPQFVRPQFPAAVFDIRDFGAVADGKTKNMFAIRPATEKAV